MKQNIRTRFKNAYNAFTSRDPTTEYTYESVGVGYGLRPDRVRFTRGNERSIVNAIFTRIAIDASSIDIKHVQLDKDGRYKEDRNSKLNNCLTLEANIDQTGRAFIQDAVMSMFDEGCIALVPIDTDDDPYDTSGFDVGSIRTGKIVTWFPDKIRVRAYNEKTGQHQEIIVKKENTPIVENPFYSIVNDHNSVLQRLIHKLNMLDFIDQQSSSGKLDMIIQMPYSTKSPTQKALANKRKADIEEQLYNSKYGIAYIDPSEKVTQLNRSVDNNLLQQCNNLSETLYSQLGITQSILDGTADEKTMSNYYSRTIEPILAVIADEMKRKWLSKTARTQGQSIMFFRDPFKLIPVTEIAEIADKMTRNEIMSTNEVRQRIGMKPSTDPRADELRNKNLSESAASDQPDADMSIADLANQIEEEIQNGG